MNLTKQVNASLEHMDAIIKSLLDGLMQRELDRCVNIIIVADHGKSYDTSSSYSLSH